MTKKICIYYIVFIAVITLVIYIFPKSPKENIALMIESLKHNKNIKAKDFDALLRLVKIPNEIENIEESIETKEKIVLKLKAIINNRALINQKWYSNGDNITDGETNFVIKNIYEQKAILLNDNNESLLLEIFPNNKDFNLEIN